MSDEAIQAAEAANASESADSATRAPSMKAVFTDGFLKKLTRTKPPIGYDRKGELIFKEDTSCKGYILWDTSQASPPGFGMRVGSKKTFVLRRKIDGKSLMPTVGNFADFKTVDEARLAAADMARSMVATGRNPNAIRREESAAELTLGQAMSDYTKFLTGRANKPARPETLKVIKRVVKKLDEWKWSGKKIRDITTKEIEEQFDKGKIFPTANEQQFRWPAAAVKWAIAKEGLAASAERREPRLDTNPFDILILHSKYREKATLDAMREEKSKRNPLRPTSSLGPFLEAAWSKQFLNDNMTGCHFLILMLLWGCRKSEHAACVWSELLKEHGDPGIGRKTTSHVCLADDEDWGPYVFFYKTKNGRSHRLPITPMALALLKIRQGAAAQEAIKRGFNAKSRQFVFPARSIFSKSGHYSDATDLLDDLRQEIKLEKLNRHDLRRSFGAVMTKLLVPPVVQRQFLNHADANATDTYTKAEWEELRTWMAKIEQNILVTAPNVYNALKPADWPAIAAPKPHVCRPPLPRTGRPKKPKAVKAEPEEA